MGISRSQYYPSQAQQYPYHQSREDVYAAILESIYRNNGHQLPPVYEHYPHYPGHVPAKPKQKGDDGKFSLFTAAKEFVKGAIVRPIKAVIEKPLLTIGVVAASVFAISAAPVLLPVMVAGGMLYGGYKGYQGIKNVLNHLNNGEYDDAERAFGDIGEGTFAIATSALGVRSAASVVTEAKAASAVASANSAAARTAALEKGIEAAAKVRGGTWTNASRELVTLFTSKAGRQALGQQLRPKTFFPAFKGKVTGFVDMFRTSPKINLGKTVEAARKHIGLSKKDMPKVITNMDDLGTAGKMATAAYNPKTHSIHVIDDPFQFAKHQVQANFGVLDDSHKYVAWMDRLPQPIKNFLANRALRKINFNNVVAHELTHAKQFHALRHLSRSQAEEVLKGLHAADDSFIGSIFDDFIKGEFKSVQFADETAKATGQAYLNGKDALTKVYEASKANSMRVVNPRGYIANASEMEARINGMNFAGRKTIKNFNKNLEITPKTISAMRDIAVEQRLNNLVSTIEGMKHAPMPNPANIQALEAELRALTQLFGHRSMTQLMLKGQYRQEALVRNMQRLMELSDEFSRLKKTAGQRFSTYSQHARQSSNTAYNVSRAQANRFTQASKAAGKGFIEAWKQHKS